MLPQILKDVAILLRDGVADGVRNIDCRRAGRNGPFDNLAQKIELRAGRVFRREFDIRTIVDGPFDHLDRLANDLLLGHLELVLPVDGAGRQKDVDPRLLGSFECLPGAVDVFFQAAGRRKSPSDRRTGGRSREQPRSLPARQWESRPQSHRRRDRRAPGQLPAFRPCSCCSREIALRRAASCRKS